ncbi:MAG: VCBS repeat-containing protein, partial [Candidatus Eisenbacteria bacterium]|nr:VCBS repeat-containing protein [Candidatus Eisenbacteria bacterium]
YNMNEGGGELAWDQSCWITAFFPANATDEDVEISCSEPLAPPPPDGMPPGVPGAMVAFEITKSTGPQLLLPVEIRVQYPPEKLLEYGGVAECALEAYRYEPGRGVWVHIPERLGINRADHAITFATTTLGLFAIAAETDGDFDGGGDFQELEWGTSPALADTDDDGLPDGDEVWWSGGDPIEPLKVHGSDQRGLGEGLISQPHYWIAGRIVAGRAASPVSTCAYIGPPIEVTYGEDWSGPALFKSDAAWGDFDEDLDADLLLMGHDGAQAVTILYRNDPPGTLAPDTVNVLTGLFAGSADWGDLDNDGDLDLLTTGSDGTQRRTIVYRNHPKGRLTADGSHGLPAVAFSDAAWGDIDKDGDVDLAFTGEESVQGRYARVYRNDKGTLTLIANMPGIYRSSCALGDVDLDGDLDVAFCGYDGGGLMTYLFENGEEGFDLFPLEFPGVREGSLHLVDADLDGDLDFFLTGADWGTGYALLYRHGGIAAEVDVGPGQPTGRTRVWLLTPSPARGEVALRYALAGDGPVRLAVYDVAGWCMRTLVEGPVAAGVYEATWDGRTDSGAEAGAGVFFYRLEGDGRVAGGRLVRVR